MDSPDSPTVSVVIPAYNEERNLGHLLQYLRDHPLGRGSLVEVLVEVSGSTDETLRVAREWNARWTVVRVVDTGARDGLLVALDRMIQMARGQVIVRIDADVRLGERCLDLLIGAVADPAVGIAGPRIMPGSSRSALVRAASNAEWAIHDQVCRIRPKTTVVQAFRRSQVTIPADSGLEDAGLQDHVVALGRRAVYVPGAMVWILPPPNVRGMLQQRMRTVQHIQDHLDRGYPRPPTADPLCVARAVLEVIRLRGASVGALVLFSVVEFLARSVAGTSALASKQAAFHWEPIEGTKDIDWSGAA
jgi:hypothetical protein